MRYKLAYSLKKRKLPSGKYIYYYRTYHKDGTRTWARSTGQTTKTAARAYCEQLIKEGKLIPDIQVVTFAVYTQNWWLWDKCKYVKYKRSQSSINKSHAGNMRKNLTKHILPYFSRFELDAISVKEIEEWLNTMQEKGLANRTININLSTLRIILKEAKRLGDININPCDAVRSLKENSKKKQILTTSEVKAFFDLLKLFFPFNNSIFLSYR